MVYLFKGLKLLWTLQYASAKGVRRLSKKIRISFQSQTIACDYYCANSASAKRKSLGLIVFIHGMNVLDTRDSRLVRLAQCFCMIGYDILMPRIPSVAQLKIQFSQRDLIAQLLAEIKNPAYKICQPHQRFGLISISFSGGIAMLAALQSPAQKDIAAMLLIGSFAKVTSVTNYFLYAKSIDEYGRNILLYNFGKYLHAQGKHLEKIFYLAAVCSSLRNMNHKKEFLRCQAQLDALEKRLTPSQKKLLHSFLNDRQFLRKNWSRAIRGAPDIYREFVPHRYVHKLQMPLILIHGEKDPVIPVSESILLAKKLKAHGKPHRLVVTRLLGHGDYQLNLRLLGDVYRFTKAVGAFLHTIRYRKKSRESSMPTGQ